jgi:hypothetical protein
VYGRKYMDYSGYLTSQVAVVRLHGGKMGSIARIVARKLKWRINE